MAKREPGASEDPGSNEPSSLNITHNEVQDPAEMSVMALRELFDGETTILYSNAAVVAVLDELLARYRKRGSRRDRIALLLHWQRDTKRLKKTLEEAAASEPISMDDGQVVPHVGAAKAQTLMERVCPADPYLPDPGGPPPKSPR